MVAYYGRGRERRRAGAVHYRRWGRAACPGCEPRRRVVGAPCAPRRPPCRGDWRGGGAAQGVVAAHYCRSTYLGAASTLASPSTRTTHLIQNQPRRRCACRVASTAPLRAGLLPPFANGDSGVTLAVVTTANRKAAS